MNILYVNAQENSFSFNFNNVTLGFVLNEIEKQTDFKIVYKNNQIDLNRTLSVEQKNESIENIIKLIFKDSQIDFEIDNKLVILFAKNSAENVVVQLHDSILKKEPIILIGLIKDSHGTPLYKANIRIKGTHRGTESDEDGLYQLLANVGDSIVVSFIGKISTNYKIGKTVRKDFVLPDDLGELQEVVITSFGLGREKAALAYSVTEVDGELFKKSRSGNVANTMSGKIAGVQVSTPATGMGGSSRVVIRGNTSIKGNNQPLYVIDGIPMVNNLLGSAGQWGGSDRGDGISNINPDEIEKVTVLKGVSAGALYGSRASNGVILITTKSGSIQQGVGVEFNSNYTNDYLASDFDFQKIYGQGSGAKKYSRIIEIMNGDGRMSWGGELDGTDVIQFDGVYRPYVNRGNAVEHFYRRGSTLVNTLTLSGGNEKSMFRASLSNTENESIMPNSGFTRYNYSLKLRHQFSSKFSANIQASYINQNLKNSIRVSDTPMNVNSGIAIFPANVHPDDVKGDPNKLGANRDGKELNHHGSIWWGNPYWAAYQSKRKDDKDRYIGKVNLKYNFTDWLYVQSTMGLDTYTMESLDVTPWGQGYGHGEGGISLTTSQFEELNKDIIIGLDKQLSKNFHTSMLFGGNQMRQTSNSKYISGSRYDIPGWDSYENTKVRSAGIGFLQKGINSLFYQAEFSFKNELFLTTTGRKDWFSTLNGRSLFYPSIGVSAVLNRMVKLPDIIDYTKIRISWGQVGGDTNPYNTVLNYEQGNPYGGNSIAQIAQDIIPNRTLTPLTASEFEIGMDLKLYGDRLGFDIAYYNRQTKNDILSGDVAKSSGYLGKLLNVGEISNKGVEILLYGTPYKVEKFNWDISFNLGYNRSKVLSLLEEDKDVSFLQVDQSRILNAYIRFYKGLPYSQISGYKYLRNDTGDLILDENGYPQADLEEGVVPFGSGVSPVSGGLSNSFSWDRINLSFLLDFRVGGYIHSGTNVHAYETGLHKNTLVGRENGIGSVTPELLQQYYWKIAENVTEEFVYKADFVKLREISLNYQLPNRLTKKIKISNIDVSLVARNLWVIHKKVPNIDPESTYHAENPQGFEYFGLPRTKSIGFNLNVKF